jgi:hypothetical protein
MKNIFGIIILLLLSNIMIGQTNLKDKLDEVFNTDKVTDILNNPQKVTYYNKVFFTSFKVKSIPAAKLTTSNYTTLNSIVVKDKTTKIEKTVTSDKIPTLINSGKFNILMTDIKRDFNKKTYYRLGNTENVLILKSYKELSN